MIEFTKRWAVQGRKPNGDNATTIFDLLDDRRRVMVYPATRADYAVLIELTAVPTLAATVHSRGTCEIPARHAVHGERVLGLRPFESPHEPPWINRPPDATPYLGPMELYLSLPRTQVRIVYRHERLQLLADTFGYLISWLP